MGKNFIPLFDLGFIKKEMNIKILWHRLWINFVVSGFCEKDNQFYWFEWDFSKQHYMGFELTSEQMEEIDKERERLEKIVGKVIYHDERYKSELAIAENSFLESVPLSNLKFEKESFIFQKKDIINPIPYLNH